MAKIFPIYFTMQTALAAVMAVTYPARGNPLGSVGGVAGVLDPSNRWGVLAPLAGAFACGLANLAVVGPATTKVMDARRQQGRWYLGPGSGGGGVVVVIVADAVDQC